MSSLEHAITLILMVPAHFHDADDDIISDHNEWEMFLLSKITWLLRALIGIWLLNNMKKNVKSCFCVTK